MSEFALFVEDYSTADKRATKSLLLLFVVVASAVLTQFCQCQVELRRQKFIGWTVKKLL